MYSRSRRYGSTRSYYRRPARVIVRRKKYFGYKKGYRGRSRLWVARRAVKVVHKYDRKRVSGPISRLRRSGDDSYVLRYVARQMSHLESFKSRALKAKEAYVQRAAMAQARPINPERAAFSEAAREFMNSPPSPRPNKRQAGMAASGDASSLGSNPLFSSVSLSATGMI